MRSVKAAADCVPSAISTMMAAWSGRGSGAPATTMYASPIVLVFPRPCCSARVSKRLKSSFRTATTRSGISCAANGGE